MDYPVNISSEGIDGEARPLRENFKPFSKLIDTSVFVKYCGDRHADADLLFSVDKSDLAACRFCLDYEIQLRKLEPQNFAKLVDSGALPFVVSSVNLGVEVKKPINPVQCGEYYLNELLYAIAKKYDLDELLSVPGQAEKLSVGIDSTLSDMRKEAAKRPELKGIHIQGKTKTAFFANLAEAWTRCKFLGAVAGLGANETKEKHIRIFQGIVYQSLIE
jgi:hypothetical protein